MRDSKEYTILDGVTPVAVTSSTDATPIVVTATSHGFSNGDLVLIFGHTTNIAANGIFRVANKTDNTFELTDRNTGADIAGTGGGVGSSGLVIPAPKIPLTQDFANAILSIITSGTATSTLKIAGSAGDTNGDSPEFGATQSAANNYSFLAAADLEDGTLTEGDTGVVVAGTDINKTYEVNTNAIKYLTVFPITWTQGVITVKLLLTSNQ